MCSMLDRLGMLCVLCWIDWNGVCSMLDRPAGMVCVLCWID